MKSINVKRLVVSTDLGTNVVKYNKELTAEDFVKELTKLMLKLGYPGNEIKKALGKYYYPTKLLKVEIGKLKAYIDELEDARS